MNLDFHKTTLNKTALDILRNGLQDEPNQTASKLSFEECLGRPHLRQPRRTRANSATALKEKTPAPKLINRLDQPSNPTSPRTQIRTENRKRVGSIPGGTATEEKSADSTTQASARNLESLVANQLTRRAAMGNAMHSIPMPAEAPSKIEPAPSTSADSST